MSWNPIASLDDRQRLLLGEYEALLLDFNRRINLISREDEKHVFRHHITHCLFLTYRRFPPRCSVVDWGTGGGLPAIPLAIAFPDVHVVAVDAIHKKVRAVRAMARRLGIHNLEARQSRADAFDGAAAYSVSRATAPLEALWTWHRQLTLPEPVAAEASCWPPGLICLKGGDLGEEIAAVGPGVRVERIDISDFTDDAYFRDKALLVCTPGVEPGADP